MNNHSRKKPVTYYDILQVENYASTLRIKESYRTLVRALHPDTRNLETRLAEDRLRQLNEAYSCLKDKKSRKAYDKALKKQKKISRQERKAVNDNKSSKGWPSSHWTRTFFNTLGEIFWPIEDLKFFNDKNIKSDKRING